VTFWVGCGWFFWVGWGGKRKSQVTFTRVGFHWTTLVFKQSHFFYVILYIEQWGFTLKTVKGLLHLVPTRTPRISGYDLRCEQKDT
jgi:hypothetical protein